MPARIFKKIITTLRQEGFLGFLKKVHHWFWFRWQVARGRVQPLTSSLYYNYITDFTRDPRIKSEDDNKWILKQTRPGGRAGVRDDRMSKQSDRNIGDVGFPRSLVSQRLPRDDRLTVNWIIPDMSAGSGGHMTIFRIVKYLQSFGHQNRIYVFGGCKQKSDKTLKQFIDENFIKTGAEFYTNLDEIKDCNALIATSWQTAYPVKAINNCQHKFYFVQDFEPWFYPMGAEYKFAENTYRFDFHHITAGPWLTKILRQNYQAQADYFDLAYNKKVYHPAYPKKPRLQSRLAFYSRPVTPRRAFELGVQAFRELYRRGLDFEVWFFGWEKIDFDVKFSYRHLGVLNEKQLAYLYNNVDLGLVFSTTNYSLLPQEMMACRCPVLDLQGPTLAGIFTDGVNIFLAEPDPIKIADKIEEILHNKDKCQQVIEQAYQYVQQFSWQKSARKVETSLLGEFFQKSN